MKKFIKNSKLIYPKGGSWEKIIGFKFLVGPGLFNANIIYFFGPFANYIVYATIGHYSFVFLFETLFYFSNKWKRKKKNQLDKFQKLRPTINLKVRDP